MSATHNQRGGTGSWRLYFIGRSSGVEVAGIAFTNGLRDICPQYHR